MPQECPSPRQLNPRQSAQMLSNLAKKGMGQPAQLVSIGHIPETGLLAVSMNALATPF